MIKRLIILFTCAFTCLSCSKAFVNESALDSAQEVFVLNVSGCVKDKETNTPLEEIRINFKVWDTDREGSAPVIDQNVYTRADGTYQIKADDFKGYLKCVLTAEDLKGSYAAAKQELIVRWSSLNKKDDTYFYNDCNFFLTRK